MRTDPFTPGSADGYDNQPPELPADYDEIDHLIPDTRDQPPRGHPHGELQTNRRIRRTAPGN